MNLLVGFLFLLTCSLWVYFDAKALDLDSGVGEAVAVFLLWIITFPIYLFRRHRVLRRRRDNELDEEFELNAPARRQARVVAWGGSGLIVVALVLSSTIATTSSPAGSNPTSVPPTAPSTTVPPTAPALSLGSWAYLTQNGSPFKATVQSIVDPGVSDLSAGPGLRYVGVIMKFADTGSGVINIDPNDFLAIIVDPGNAQYEASFTPLNNCAAFGDDGLIDIGPGATESGCVTVSVPTHATVREVVLTGSNSVLATWEIS